MSRTYGTPHIAVYIYQPLKWQATFVLPLWGVFGGIFADNHFKICVIRAIRGKEYPYNPRNTWLRGLFCVGNRAGLADDGYLDLSGIRHFVLNLSGNLGT